jgi:hypothetical protein
VEVARDGGSEVGHAYRRLRRDVIAVQGRRLTAMYADGTVGEATRRRLQRQLDLEDARFGDDP